jgi:signal transduction histidine kinase
MRMRMTLLLSVMSVSFGLTALTLVVIHRGLQHQIQHGLRADLQRSIAVFRDQQILRREMLSREAALLADLPSLKALMTVLTRSDPESARTVRDQGVEFWHVSGADLFALADPNEQVVARYEAGVPAVVADSLPPLPDGLFTASGPRYVLHDGRLYEVISAPLYFGSSTEGTLLGYVAIGYAIDQNVAKEVGRAADAQVMFTAGSGAVASTLNQEQTNDFIEQEPRLLRDTADGTEVRLGQERYMETSRALSHGDSSQVRLVVLKSYDQASRYLTRLDQLLLLLGLVVFVLAGALAFYISETITRPLDALVAGARALGSGDFGYVLPRGGVMELRELSSTFDQMRTRLRRTQQELLEAERLATIGRMASSISHDLRHYLSAVYANAEFLGSWSGNAEEKAELLAEVKMGVTGMTDLIESLLIFSRTGKHLQPHCESLALAGERAIAMVRTHPDAQGINVICEPLPQLEAWFDSSKVERAIYNLLLNACQSAHKASTKPQVTLSLEEGESSFRFYVVDNGPGVSEEIRVTLFEPFVSKGKSGGVGLGLTLAERIAQEHGGSVELESSEPGRTVFCLSLARQTLLSFEEAQLEQPSIVPQAPEK